MRRGDFQCLLKNGSVGYNPSKKCYYFGYKATYITDGRFLTLLFINPANQHDKDILEENYGVIVKEFKNCVIIGDKGYIDKGLQNLFKLGGVQFIAIKRKNMIKSNEEREIYSELNKSRKIIETKFSEND